MYLKIFIYVSIYIYLYTKSVKECDVVVICTGKGELDCELQFLGEGG